MPTIAPEKSKSSRSDNLGSVSQIIGSTFDVQYPEKQLPAIYNAVKVAVRPEAWHIDRDGNGLGLAATLRKRSYLGSFFEYTFDTALGSVFVVSPDLTNVLEVGTEVGLSLGTHGVSVVKAG